MSFACVSSDSLESGPGPVDESGTSFETDPRSFEGKPVSFNGDPKLFEGELESFGAAEAFSGGASFGGAAGSVEPNGEYFAKKEGAGTTATVMARASTPIVIVLSFLSG